MKRGLPTGNPLNIYISFYPCVNISPCLYLRVMHPPSVPADRHISIHPTLYLHTDRLFRYHSDCDLLHIWHHTRFIRQLPNSLCGYNVRHAFAYFGAFTGFSPCREAFRPLRHHGFFGGELLCCHGYFQTATSNSKIVLRDPFLAASKPIYGIVCACPILDCLNRTLVSRPSCIIQNRPGPTARRTICLYYYHTLKPIFQTLFLSRFLYVFLLSVSYTRGFIFSSVFSKIM